MPKSDKKAGMVEISKWQFGGLAHSKWSGTENSLYKMTGLDPHSTPGILKVEQKLSKYSASTVDELCKVAVNSSNGAQYWFSATSGKIWEITSGGTVRLVHTTTPAAGGAACYGAAEYQGYIYWATQSRLHRITVANADNNNWSADAAEDWATFGVTGSYHPMTEVNLVLYIGDGNQVAQVDAGTFSANALDIKSPLIIKSLGKIGTDLLIGTYVADTVTSTEIIRWNTWSVSFTNSDAIPENGINAFLPADNMVLVQAGDQGNIYYYDGVNLELFSRIPGDYSTTKYGEVYPYSVANKGGQILFGFSNISGNPADQGVYRMAKYSRDFPYILDFPYPVSPRSGGEFVTTGLNIGAILVVGRDLYVAWGDNGSTYGIDKLDTSNKLNGAYFETRVLNLNREAYSNFSSSFVAYSSLPASTDVNMYLDVNYAGYGSALSKIDDTDRNVIMTENENREFTTLQLKAKFTTNNNDSPDIESAAILLR